MKAERITLGKFTKGEINKSMQSKISGGQTDQTWENSPNGYPDKTTYTCTGNLFDKKEYDYNGRLRQTTTSPKPEPGISYD